MFIWLLPLAMFVFLSWWGQVIKLSGNNHKTWRINSSLATLHMPGTAGWPLMLQDRAGIIPNTWASLKESVREKSCTEALKSFSSFFTSFVLWQQRQHDENENVWHPMNWLAHPTCQTPLGKMRIHQKKQMQEAQETCKGEENWVTVLPG